MSHLDRLKEEYSDCEQSNAEHEYDVYGKTPPRTKLLRKYKEKNYREKEKMESKMKKEIGRRNTIGSHLIFNELISKADSSDAEPVGKKLDKRNSTKQRGFERDLKLDIVSAQNVSADHSGPLTPHTPQPRQVEICKQFKSLCSKRVSPNSNGTGKHSINRSRTINLGHEKIKDYYGCPSSRVSFYVTLNKLINMGSFTDRQPRRGTSKEDDKWQTELMDIIWLELRALRADRTTYEEDYFLCLARECVQPLLLTIMNYKFERDKNVEEHCAGCLSMYCACCIEAQNVALKEVEDLMARLEEVESLFPSSRAFGELFPLYVSREFVGRVKAMCLWYNMTKHQRLKLVILGKLLAMLENKYYQWPIQYVENGLDSSSPTDSNSSNSSINDYLIDKTPIDMYNISPIASLVNKKSENSVSPYRKYIENILKTRGLGKSMSFLDRLHKHVLRKSQITLQKPRDESIFNDEEKIDHNQEQELIRYGSWSPEAESLSLPSYKAAFLFLSAVPLEVIHEFLRMRIEQKPEKPSPLSVRQLMRELKEGIKIAVSQRERITWYWDTVIDGNDELSETYGKNLTTFDKTLQTVMEDYLEYMGTWALFQHDTFQKSLLEEEWYFICDNLKNIPEAFDAAGKKYCSILETMMTAIGKRLMGRIEELAVEITTKDDEQNRKQNLFAVCRELQGLFHDEREMSIKVISFAKTIFRSGMNRHNFEDFKTSVVALKCTIPNAIERVQHICDSVNLDYLDESEKVSFISRCREILMQGYQFGFEFYKEMSELVPAERKKLLARSMVQFAQLWMNFAQQRCERGRGKRPRWAYQGMDFLLTVCEPQYTQYLTDDEFEDLKENMDKCISHVIGTTAPSTPDSGFYSSSPRPSIERFPKSRGSSPSPRPTYKSQRSASRKTSVEQNSPIDPNLEAPNFCLIREDSLHETLEKMKHAPILRSVRVKEAVDQLDKAIEAQLRKEELIGAVINKQQPDGMKQVRRRNVIFSWQRGIKIGQGRFGKVYTAVNNDTGEMMAVKEVAIQRNDCVTIRKTTEEIKIMEGISHKNLVKYYGLEVHKEEMLIFMEFCPEGTLESLVAATESGLPEPLIHRYTYQLVSGVAVLHDHGIVHRDIKSANIFLTDEGNCLKIGDFGCAVKIKTHVTMPGELQGFVGTQAYMAPEMFMKTSVEGHGRAADIWSVGCVVVEMASGKRPWAQYDSNYQIMFKVGMGQKPEAPETLTDEGHDFLDRCFQHDPKRRATAFELLGHNFVKVGDDLN